MLLAALRADSRRPVVFVSGRVEGLDNWLVSGADVRSVEMNDPEEHQCGEADPQAEDSGLDLIAHPRSVAAADRV